jgi:hypothetical protein
MWSSSDQKRVKDQMRVLFRIILTKCCSNMGLIGPKACRIIARI